MENAGAENSSSKNPKAQNSQNNPGTWIQKKFHGQNSQKKILELEFAVENNPAAKNSAGKKI